MGQKVCVVLWAFPSLLSVTEGYLRFPTVCVLRGGDSSVVRAPDS